MALQFQRLEFPFARGLNQKADPRLTQEPELVRAVDVDFDNLGGLRLRYPYSSIGANIFGGGTISGCRRVYSVGDELILFTSTALYSWSSQQSAWVSRGTHLAVKTKEKPVFINTSEQTDCDRAQLSGTVVYAWGQTVSGTASVYAAAVDASTGAVLMSPTLANLGGGATHPRLCALSTKILLVYEDGTGALAGVAIDPAAPATALAGADTTILAAASFNTYYDIEKIPGADSAIIVCRRDVTTSYEVIKCTAGLSLTTSTKARTCDGPIAVACDTGGTNAQIMRANGTNIEGDLLLVSDLSDVYTAQALGSGTTTINQVTGAFADTATCHVFWHSNENTNSTAFDADYNTVTTSNSVGTAARFKYRLGLASRAFMYNAEVYVWTVFSGASSFSGASPSAFYAQLQNTYYLYRADGHMVTKAAWQRAGGFQTAGLLPGVQLTSGSTVYSWAGTEKRVIELGENQSGYADRGPRDITFTFDSNEARRVAKIGETVYISGFPLQYDGRDITEVGFTPYPWYFGAIEVASGNLKDGTYTFKVGWRYDNAKGERERSTTATAGQVTIASGPNGVEFPANFVPLHTTRKSDAVVEVWRTPVNATSDSPFYLVTSPDPTSLTNPNRYLPNDATASTISTFDDEYADSTLTTKEPHPEADGVIENMAPPNCTLIAANDTRLFLAGLSDLPHYVAYSKQRNPGEICSFNEVLTVPVPEPGGDITGLAFLNETLVVFRETAVYALDGIGFDNTGGGQNYQARLVTNTEGAVSQESICLSPNGLVFKSSKGWYLLNRGWTTQYIGGPVRDYDSETVYSAHVVETNHQVRIVTSGRILIWDYLVDAWAEWSITDGLHATMWNGTYHYLATASVKAEQTSYSTADYAWDVEMLIHLGGLQGFARVRRIMALGEVRGTGTIRFRVGSYAEGTYFDDRTWTISPTSAGSELDVEHQPSRQQQKSLRVRLTTQATAGEKPQLSAIALEVGLKQSVYRLRPAAQKQ